MIDAKALLADLQKLLVTLEPDLRQRCTNHADVDQPLRDQYQSLNEVYRNRFGACHGKYSLAVPFFQRFFDLAVSGDSAGFVGMITTNAIMKRDFGKKLIQEYVPRWDLSHIIDTSGAFVPGHGTPTVRIFGRNRHPTSTQLRAVMGIRGEPTRPEDPASGCVWSAIVSHTLRLSERARAKLAEKAANSGQDVSAVASDLIEQSVARPTADEVLAPFRKQVAESGMSDEELDEFHRGLLAQVRSEKKARES